MFDFVPVSPTDYLNISMNYPQMNLKTIYEIVLEDRRHSRKSSIANLSPRKVRTKTVVEKQIVEKVVYKPKIEKQIVEKVVYVDRTTGEKTRKPRTPKPVLKEESKIINTIKKQPVKTRIDDLTDDDFIKDMEQQKRDRFKEELMRRMKNG